MPAFLALALLLQDPAHASGRGNTAAISAFEEACVQGTLRLTPDRGRVLKAREVTDFVYLSDWGRPKGRATVVKLSSGPSSYLVIKEYKNLQPNSIARVCALVSGDVSKEEAAAAYLHGLPDKPGTWAWYPNVLLPTWTADHPEHGYRKRLRFRSDGSIVLEVGMYPAAAAQLSAGAAKQ